MITTEPEQEEEEESNSRPKFIEIFINSPPEDTLDLHDPFGLSCVHVAETTVLIVSIISSVAQHNNAVIIFHYQFLPLKSFQQIALGFRLSSFKRILNLTGTGRC